MATITKTDNQIKKEESIETPGVNILFVDRECSTRNGGIVHLQGLGSRALKNLPRCIKNRIVTSTRKSIIGE